jgi:ribonucleoside-diphosphate reductase alpha subunit
MDVKVENNLTKSSSDKDSLILEKNIAPKNLIEDNYNFKKVKDNFEDNFMTDKQIIESTKDTNTIAKMESFSTTMRVNKRTGEKEEISFDKITKRIKKLSHKLNINATELAQTIISQIYDGIHTSQIDELAAEICAARSTVHPDYGVMASRIIISNHHKNTSPSFSEVMQTLWDNVDIHNKHTPIINKELYEMTMANKEKINSVIDYDKDYNFDYFGFKTLERAYLLKIGKKVIERPQHMIMRVSLAIHKDDIKDAIKSYKIMCEGFFTHATPTLFNMGTQREQAFSCFLLQMEDDSIGGIYKTLSDCAHISKYAGGIGIATHKIRAKGSQIRGTNGRTDGLVPMLKVFNETARYVNQAGRRKGSFAIYLEPWHADIEDFLMLRRNTGAESERARDLFYSMWIPDLFMERVKEGGDWTLMCPDECPGLHEVYGNDFVELYTKYEKEGRGRKTIKAQKIWETIIDSQIETGTPYIGFKDAVNKKTNQKNLGVIQSSNLCIEIVEYTSPEEHAVCCLLSVALPKYLEPVEVKDKIKVYSKTDCKFCSMAKNLLKRHNLEYEEINLDDDKLRKDTFKEINNAEMVCDDGGCELPEGGLIKSVPQIYFGDKRIGGFYELQKALVPTYNFEKLREVTKMSVRNLNKLIDYNFYPVPETETSNRRHRPIGVGVQGLADVLAKMRIPFDSQEGVDMSRKIAEHMYFAACESSMEIARRRKRHVQEYRRLLKKEDKTEEEVSQMNTLKEQHFIYQDEVDKLPMGLAGAYSTFVGSPASQGELQFDLWDVEPSPELKEEWDRLKGDVKKHGIRNSLLMAMMPTASTSQILGNNECIEPYTNNIYTRQTLAGTFTIVNKHLIRDLLDLNMWNKDMKDKIILANGSIQNIAEIPKHIKDLYKVVWEMKQKWLIDHAAARAPFVCQTQSMNLFMKDPTPKKINAMHFYSWRQGLKTGIYYLRSLAKTQGQKFSVDIDKVQKNDNQQVEEECLACSA